MPTPQVSKGQLLKFPFLSTNDISTSGDLFLAVLNHALPGPADSLWSFFFFFPYYVRQIGKYTVILFHLTPCRSLLMVLTVLDAQFTALPHDSHIRREELVFPTNEVQVVLWPFWGVRSCYLYLTHYICYQWWDMTSHIRIVTQRSVLDRQKDRQKDYLWPDNKKCPASTSSQKNNFILWKGAMV